MTVELAKAYNPKEAQERFLAFWEEQGFFHSKPQPGRDPFTIVIPPPNVTGALHMGHALNNTLQDVLIRWRRMQGFNSLWMPGTDHAGIATQAVVERLVFQQEKKTRHDLGRDALVQRIWDWKDRYEKRILGQLRQLGASCDWTRTRFTLDPICARAVRQTFFNLFKDGLVFRGKRLVNWDAFLQTSVANDEVENVEQNADFYYLKYPFVEGATHDGLDHVLIATTRPETMLGDTCVAVHPNPRAELERRQRKLHDELAKASDKERKEIAERLERLSVRRDTMLPHLEKLAALAQCGVKLELPLVGRAIPLIADDYADPEKGTGAVKITPAHDFNDWEVGKRHPEIGAPINILQPDGKINDVGQGTFRSESFSYVGQDRFAARKQIVADLERLGLVERIEPIKNTIPLSDRSKTPIEPYLSDQWFVKMGDREDGKPGLAQMAIDAVVEGKVAFTPARYMKSYIDWLDQKVDWCISRQLWWGHRIPVWSRAMPTSGGWSDADLDFNETKNRYIAEGRLAEQRRGIPELGTDESTGRKQPNFSFCVKEENDKEVVDFLHKWRFTQDVDVLDTWFSSALWPHSTLGWPEQTEELNYYYPTSVLVTSRDIITLWVARMVITGLYNLGKVPFHHVYIHPKMMDGFGETMSKSRGNGIDPLDIIDRYGADALRFGVLKVATETQDSRLPVSNVCPHCDALVPVKQEHMYMRTRKVTCPTCKGVFRPGGPWPSEDTELKTAKQASDRFEEGRNFANKIWNAARFILMNLDGYTPLALKRDELPLEDRWILSRLATATERVTAALEQYRFSAVGDELQSFIWSEFCDWYIEMAKGRLQGEGRATVQRVLVGVLDAILKLIQPIMPFLADSLWQALNEAAFERGLPNPDPACESVVRAAWPALPASWKDATMETRIARMQELVRAVREVRNRYNVEPRTALDVSVRCAANVADDFRLLAPFVVHLAGVGSFNAAAEVAKPPQSASHVTPDFEVFVSLKGLIDPVVELKRQEKQLAEKTKFVQGLQAKLDNAGFMKNAPEAVVQQLRKQLADTQQQIAAIEENLRELRGG